MGGMKRENHGTIETFFTPKSTNSTNIKKSTKKRPRHSYTSDNRLSLSKAINAGPKSATKRPKIKKFEKFQTRSASKLIKEAYNYNNDSLYIKSVRLIIKYVIWTQFSIWGYD